MSEFQSTAYRPADIPRGPVRGGGRGGDLDRVARYQKLVILGLLLNFGVQVIAFATSGSNNTSVLLLVLSLSLVAAVVSILGLANLMLAMGSPVINRILAVIAMFLPLINLIVLLVVNGKATTRLKAGGYRVGLLGAKR